MRQVKTSSALAHVSCTHEISGHYGPLRIIFMKTLYLLFFVQDYLNTLHRFVMSLHNCIISLLSSLRTLLSSTCCGQSSLAIRLFQFQHNPVLDVKQTWCLSVVIFKIHTAFNHRRLLFEMAISRGPALQNKLISNKHRQTHITFPRHTKYRSSYVHHSTSESQSK